MQRAILAIDCETHLAADIPDERRAEIARREAAGERLSVKPYEWDIAVIGHALIEPDPDSPAGMCITRLGEIGTPDWSEADRLAGFFEVVRAKKPRILTWNGRRFDLPTILTRALVLGVPSRGFEKGRYLYRYSDEHHIDLMDQLSQYGAGTNMDLDGCARASGLPGKPPGVDGASVAAMIAAGRRADVVDYCGSDIVNLAGLCWRWLHQTGQVSADQHDAFLRHLGGRVEELLPSLAPRWCWRPIPRDIEPWRRGEAALAAPARPAPAGDEVAPRDLNAAQ